MGAASAVDTHVTYEILLSGGHDARGSGFGAAQRRAEVRVSSHLGGVSPLPLPLAPFALLGPSLPSLSVSVNLDWRDLRKRDRRFTDTDKEGREGEREEEGLWSWLRWWVDTHSLFECVSTWAGHRFGSECVSGAVPGTPKAPAAGRGLRLQATNRTSRRRVGCARPTAPKWPPGNRPSPHRADSPTARPPHTPQRLRAR